MKRAIAQIQILQSIYKKFQINLLYFTASASMVTKATAMHVLTTFFLVN